MRKPSATVLRRFLANLRSYLEVADHSADAAIADAGAARDLPRLRAALDASGDAIFIIDVASMQFVDVNAAATYMFGYSREELFAIGPADLSRQSRERLSAKYNDLILTPDRIETVEMRCNDPHMQAVAPGSLKSPVPRHSP